MKWTLIFAALLLASCVNPTMEKRLFDLQDQNTAAKVESAYIKGYLAGATAGAGDAGARPSRLQVTQ